MINAGEINRWFKNVNLLCSKHDVCKDCPLVGEDERGEYCRWEDGDMTQDEVDMIAAYEPPVDWSKVPVDTKVVVWDNPERKYKRYFAKYQDGQIYTYEYGSTSWSTIPDLMVRWKYGRLAEDDE